MASLAESTDAVRRRATGYDVQDRLDDLLVALEHCRQVLTARSANWEDEVSGQQIRNIVYEVVPIQEILKLQVELALATLNQGGMSELKADVSKPEVVGRTRFWDNESMDFVVDWVCAERDSTGT